jgi:hypothetical protein
MSHHEEPIPKRQRRDEAELGLPPRKRHENIAARGHPRQHNGDHYGDIIYQGAAATASTSESGSIRDLLLERLLFEEMDARYLTINASLAPKSCRWLLERPEYER